MAGHREEGKSDGEDSEKEESDDEDEEDLCSLRVPLGLKNQGCTCYMNSLLQQLFLCKSFRDKILSAKIPERYRMSIWHRHGESLVGCTIAIHHDNNVNNSNTGNKKQQFVARVVAFDNATQKHELEFGEKRHTTKLDLRSRMNTCTVIGDNDSDATVAASCEAEMDEVQQARKDAYNVLSELQRCFCYMLWSNYTYYDPKPLVDACQCLRMEYTVYQQVRFILFLCIVQRTMHTNKTNLLPILCTSLTLTYDFYHLFKRTT